MLNPAPRAFYSIWATRPILSAVALAALLFAALQLWRPCFFLTDDNLSGTLPTLHEIGSNIFSRKPAFTSSILFGGDYALLSFVGNLMLTHPLYLLAALIAASPLKYTAIDFLALINLLLSAGFMATLLKTIRDRHQTGLGNFWVVLLSLSYTYSYYILAVGPSWGGFIANQASLPMIVWALLLKNNIRSIAWTTLGIYHAFMGGHQSPFLYSCAFLSLFVMLHAICAKDYRMVLRWFLSGIAVLAITSPLTMPALQNFLQEARSSGISGSSYTSLPLLHLLSSSLVGIFSALLGFDYGLWHLPPAYAYGICFAMANLVVALCLFTRNPWNRFQFSLLIMLIITGIFVARPAVVAGLVDMIPILRALRWPFREIFNFIFFSHLLLAFRPAITGMKMGRIAAVIGFALFLAPLCLLPPPSLSSFNLDRHLIFSGAADRHWARIREIMPENSKIVPILNVPKNSLYDPRIPFSLIGGYNYPQLFHVPSISGYTITGFDNPHFPTPHFWGGCYREEMIPELKKRSDNLVFLSLVSLDPVVVRVQTPTETMDLTVPEPLR